jgi:2-polyprenyl-3-methyl-5-hydroxy-6-metoxy-1,4-benzoquinol methylase
MASETQYFQANRGPMSAFLPDNYKRVLEIGCAAGGFSDHLKQSCEVWGVEPNRSAASIAALKLHRVLVGTYNSVAETLPERYFDLVICNDVIEHMDTWTHGHMDDHDAFLEAIKNKMIPGGYIVGSIPNVRHITALFKMLIIKDWKYSESGILDRTHLRFFTAKSLRRTLQEHAYRIEKFAGLSSIIRNGISRATDRPNAAQDVLYRLITVSVICLTLGFYWDTQYPQYGFRATLG